MPPLFSEDKMSEDTFKRVFGALLKIKDGKKQELEGRREMEEIRQQFKSDEDFEQWLKRYHLRRVK
jgi:hypothetical protein